MPVWQAAVKSPGITYRHLQHRQCVLRNNDANNFNNNVKLKNYSIRSNTDINLTKSTVAKVRVYGQFDDYTGPIGEDPRSSTQPS